MKRRVEDQELVFAPRQQQSHHPAVQGIAESFQQRTLISAPAILEAAADNMQPSTGIQYSLSHSYQVWVFFNLFKLSWKLRCLIESLVLKVAWKTLMVFCNVIYCPPKEHNWPWARPQHSPARWPPWPQPYSGPGPDCCPRPRSSSHINYFSTRTAAVSEAEGAHTFANTWLGHGKKIRVKFENEIGRKMFLCFIL